MKPTVFNYKNYESTVAQNKELLIAVDLFRHNEEVMLRAIDYIGEHAKMDGSEWIGLTEILSDMNRLGRL